MADFIPHADDTLNTWLVNYKTKLPIHAATLGIAPADVAIYVNECDALVTTIQGVNNSRKSFQNLVKAKDDQRTDTVGNVRTISNRIKTNANYTAAIGNDLGIIGTVSTSDFSTAKPQLAVATSGGHMVISFKKGQSNGVKIYGNRGSEAAFSFLALDTHSPYHDNRPNLVEGTPETRHYYAYFVDATDQQVGLQSDIVSGMI